MARKAKHDQKSLPATFVCDLCRVGVCERCIDVARYLVGWTDPICNCKRQGHSGEANEKQITDPTTGTVWGPGLRVTTDGEVIHGGYED